MKHYCGIDPGFSGAICILDAKKRIILLEDMPILKVGQKDELNEPQIKKYLSECSDLSVLIEKAQTMPGQGISSSGRYMASYGLIRGICVGMSLQYSLIHPKTWKKLMMNDMPKEKEASIQKVGQLYPDLVLTRKKDHGKSDALLIALYHLKYGDK
mgnify:CR=1 FL=1|tara:strand:- start:149 stop:616 length:468 start_codon:yes stop_codon:yes gene_type:complete